MGGPPEMMPNGQQQQMPGGPQQQMPGGPNQQMPQQNPPEESKAPKGIEVKLIPERQIKQQGAIKTIEEYW